MGESVLLVEVPEADGLVGRWRARYDPVASRGIPAHVTVLYPFVRPPLDDDTRRRVAEVVAGAPAFEAVLAGVDAFPGVVWLRPEPDDPFRDLTRRVGGAFPDHPPYEGRYPDPQPHLTVASVVPEDGEDDLQRVLELELADVLPLPVSVAEVSLFTSDDDGWWSLAERFPLGGG